jgi:hypothetical protein
MSTYQALFGSDPFTVSDARGVGWGYEDIRRFVRDGQVRRVLKGVYVDATVQDDLASRAAALAKVVPSGDVICLRTAGWLWSADVLPIGAHREIPPVDLMAPSGAAGPRRADCRGRTGPIAAYDVMTVQGVLSASGRRSRRSRSAVVRAGGVTSGWGCHAPCHGRRTGRRCRRA